MFVFFFFLIKSCCFYVKRRPLFCHINSVSNVMSVCQFSPCLSVYCGKSVKLFIVF